MRVAALPLAASLALLAAPVFAQNASSTPAAHPYAANPAARTQPYGQTEGTNANQPYAATHSAGTPPYALNQNANNEPPYVAGSDSNWTSQAQNSHATGNQANRPYAAAPQEGPQGYAENPDMSASAQPYRSENQQQNLRMSLDTQQKLEQSLKQSGFHDVTVTPRTFVIHAQAPDGSRIVMVVGPDQTRGVIISNNENSSQPDESMQNGPSNSHQNDHNGRNPG